MLRTVSFLPFYFYFQLPPSNRLSDLSAWMSPRYLGLNRFQAQLIHFTPPHTLLPLPTRFPPRLPQFSKCHHPSTRHPLVNARNVGGILDSVLFSHSHSPHPILNKSQPFHLWAISQLCPLLSICLAPQQIPGNSCLCVSSYFLFHPSQSIFHIPARMQFQKHSGTIIPILTISQGLLDFGIKSTPCSVAHCCPSLGSPRALLAFLSLLCCFLCREGALHPF